MSARGATLLEALISIGMLSMLFGILLATYLTGASAAHRGDTRAELLGEAQVALTSLTHDLERSSAAGVSVAPDHQSLAVISAFDEDGQYELDDEGKPLWRGWWVYYQEGDELRRAAVEWPGTPTDRATPIPIEQLAPPKTVLDYETNGRVIARHVYAVDLQTLPSSATSVRLELRKKRYGREAPEAVVLETMVRTRNP